MVISSLALEFSVEAEESYIIFVELFKKILEK